MSDRDPATRLARVLASIGPALWLLAAIGFISQVGISVMLPLLPLLPLVKLSTFHTAQNAVGAVFTTAAATWPTSA